MLFCVFDFFCQTWLWYFWVLCHVFEVSSFLLLFSIPLYEYIVIFCDGYWNYFEFWTVTNNAAVTDFIILELLCMHFCWNKHAVLLPSNLVCPEKQVFKMAALIYTLIISVWGFVLFLIPSNTDTSESFRNSHYVECLWHVIMVLICIFMITNDNEHVFLCLLAIGYFLFWNASLLFCPLFYWVSCLFVIDLCEAFIYLIYEHFVNCQLYVLLRFSPILQLFLLIFKTLNGIFSW